MAAIIRQIVRLLIAVVMTAHPNAPKPASTPAGAQPRATVRVPPVHTPVLRIASPIQPPTVAGRWR